MLWVIEQSNKLNTEKLRNAIEENNQQYLSLPYDHISSIDKAMGFPQFGLYYGTIRFIKEVVKKRFVEPGSYARFERYNFLNWSSKIDNDLLFNNNFLVTNLFSEATIRKYINRYGSIFIRPNSSEKTFCGGLYDEKEYNNLLKEFSYKDQEIICIIAEPKSIHEEYRLVMNKSNVLDISRYIPDEKRLVGSALVGLLSDFAEKIYKQVHKNLHYSFFDKLYTMDIHVNKEGDFQLMEINSFSCAGLYDCDFNTLVQKIKVIAKKDYEDNFER